VPTTSQVGKIGAMVSHSRRLKQKRREHRKKKQEDKRRAATMGALLPVPGKVAPRPGELKVSAALKEVARPLLDSLPEGLGIDGVRYVMLLAMTSWNAAVLRSPAQADKDLQQLSRKFAKGSREHPEPALPLLRLLAERKWQLFPYDDRVVMNVEVEDRGDQYSIIAASMRRPR
jgi:hypothetical protein